MNKYEELLTIDAPVLIHIKQADHYRDHARIRLLARDGDKDICRYMFSPAFKNPYVDILATRSCFVPDLCRSRSMIIELMQRYDEASGLIIVEIVRIP